MTDTKSASVAELRQILKEKYNLTEEEIESLGSKSGVAARLRDLEALEELGPVVNTPPIRLWSNDMSISDEDLVDDSLLDNAEIVADEQEAEEPGQAVPTWRDKNWTEYVISLMDESELRDGHPTVDGLRRITEVLIGDIVVVQSEVVQVPTPENECRATVKVSVVVEGSEKTYQFDGAADVTYKNTDPVYAKHPVATAESRAESRAYRRLLRLRNIISAEEVSKESTGEDPFDKIQDHQIDAIDRLAEKVGINVSKWLESQEISVLNIKDLSRSKGQELLKALNGMRDTSAVPDSIKGYENWR